MDYVPRHGEAKLRRLAAHFPAVLVVGAWQVGKTTLVGHVFPKPELFTFDPVADLHGARRDPEFFLEQHPPPLILDEVQYAPELLPAIKRRLDGQQRKGRYLLTGSQNLSLMIDGELWPIEIKCSGRPTIGDERGFRALRETYPKHRIRPSLLIAAVPDVRRLSRETTVVPWDLAPR